MRTPEEINAILDEVRASLQNRTYGERSEAVKRGAQELQKKAVVDRTKLHKPRTI